MKKKKLTYRGRTVKVSAETYLNNGHLALMLTYRNGETEVITVNLNSRFQSDSLAFIDTNNHPEAEKFIITNELGVPMGVTERSGFCQYPLYTIFTKSLWKRPCNH